MRYLIVFALFSVLTACGFQPTYHHSNTGTSNASAGVKSALNDVTIDVIPDRSGQFLRNRLIDRFYHSGYPSAPSYRLSIAPIEENIVEIGIDKDATASRAQLRMQTSFSLYNLDTGEKVLQRTQRATTGYNILSGQFTTFITEEDARKQGLNLLADQITTQLELYFARPE